MRISQHPHPQIIICEWETDLEHRCRPAGSSLLPIFPPSSFPPTGTQVDTCPPGRHGAQPRPPPWDLLFTHLFSPRHCSEGCVERKKRSLHYDHHIKLQIHSHWVEELTYQLLLSQEFSGQKSAGEQGHFDITLHCYPSRA